MNGILAAIQDGKSTFGRLAVDTAMGERVQHIIDNLAKTSDALAGTEGTVGVLLNDPGTAANVRTIVADLHTLVADTKDGKGALGRLLRDETLANDLSSSLGSLSMLLQKANDPNAGIIGALTSDADLGREFKEAIVNLRLITEKLNGTDSMLGILISDKDVGVRFRRIMTQVSRALEDAREAAPISNFVQVLFGVF
jgi:phospholipid/cholesterol/gamma-HCH transport system substrate-binding protein